MNAIYPATYHDQNGTIKTSIHNDGNLLTMVVRGVTFSGSDFDSLEPESNAVESALESFTLQSGQLCSCVIDATIPLPVMKVDLVEDGDLLVHLELGDPCPNGGIDRQSVLLDLRYSGVTWKSRRGQGHFEDALLDIQRQLPEGAYMLACINCAFSDYFPAGSGMFGTMACFRDNKQAYKAVSSKHELFQIWSTLTEFVQETYLCPDFERRVPGAGYRG